MKLAFANGKVIQSGGGDGAWAAYREALRATTGPEPVGEDERRHLGAADLTEAEKEQLVGILRKAFGMERETFTAEEVFSGESPHELLRETAEGPVEWWDIVDEAGRVRFQIWTYHADCGSLVEAGTSNEVGAIIQFGFEVEVEDPDDALARAMSEAHAELRRRCPKSEFAGMSFAVGD